MNLYCITLTIYGSLAKISTNDGINIFDLCFVRAIVNLLIAGIVVVITSQNLTVKEGERWLVIVRSIVGLTGFTTMVYSLQVLPLAIGLIILNMSPFCTAILSYAIKGEQLTKTEFVCMLGCFTGVVILGIAK